MLSIGRDYEKGNGRVYTYRYIQGIKTLAKITSHEFEVKSFKLRKKMERMGKNG